MKSTVPGVLWSIRVSKGRRVVPRDASGIQGIIAPGTYTVLHNCLQASISSQLHLGLTLALSMIDKNFTRGSK